MKEFFLKILDSKDTSSSRRFAALISLVLFTVAVICSLAGVNVESDILYSTAALTTAALGLTTITH